MAQLWKIRLGQAEGSMDVDEWEAQMEDRWRGFAQGQFWRANPWGDEEFKEGLGRGDDSIPYRDIEDGQPRPDEDHVWFMHDYLGGSDYSGGLVTRSNYDVMLQRLDDLKEEHGDDYYQTLHGGYGTYAIAFHVERTPDEVIEMIGSLEDYPLLDEDAHSEALIEAQSEAWERWGESDYRRALEEVYGGDADDVGDDELYNHFHDTAERIGEYWEETSESEGVYIDVKRVAESSEGPPKGFVYEED